MDLCKIFLLFLQICRFVSCRVNLSRPIGVEEDLGKQDTIGKSVYQDGHGKRKCDKEQSFIEGRFSKCKYGQKPLNGCVKKGK